MVSARVQGAGAYVARNTACAMIVLIMVACLAPTAASATDRPVLAATKTALLVWLADELGLLSGLPIDLVMRQSGTIATSEVLSGRAALATSSEFSFVSHALEERRLNIIASISASRTTRLLARADRVGPSIMGLEGRRIGVTTKGIGEYFLWQLLYLEGLSFADVEIVDLPPTMIADALVDGSIDAGLTWEPYVYDAVQRLGPNKREFKEESDHYFSFLLLGDAPWVAANQDLVADLLQALVTAELFADKEPEAAKRLIAKRFGVDRQFMDYLWPRHSLHVGLSQELVRQMEIEAQWRIEEGRTTATALPNFLSFLDPSALRRVAPRSITVVGSQ
jgi:ABC-type nitrate/sulfonate/bicarbonate transport system substrate-binding protein